MYQKPKTKKTPTYHPHFVQEVGNGKVRMVDAPPIREEIDPEMFSLSVNRLNKQNLQPVATELSNRLDGIHALEREVQSLDDSIAEYQRNEKAKADAAAFEKEFGFKKETDDGK